MATVCAGDDGFEIAVKGGVLEGAATREITLALGLGAGERGGGSGGVREIFIAELLQFTLRCKLLEPNAFSTTAMSWEKILSYLPEIDKIRPQNSIWELKRIELLVQTIHMENLNTGN